MTDPFTGTTPIIPAEDSEVWQLWIFPRQGSTLSAVFSPAAVSGNFANLKMKEGTGDYSISQTQCFQ